MKDNKDKKPAKAASPRKKTAAAPAKKPGASGSGKSASSSSKKKETQDLKKKSGAAVVNSAHAAGKRKAPADKKKSRALKNPPAVKKQRGSSKLSNPPAVIKKTDPPALTDSSLIDRGDTPMSVVDHLDEFRHRFLISLIVLVCFTAASFFLSDLILKFVSGPFLNTGKALNIFTMTGGFIARLKTSAVAAVLISLPVFIYHVWKYIEPAVEVPARRGIKLSLAGALLLFYAGISFVFFIVLPFTVSMLISFIDGNMIPTIEADDYLSFIFLFCLAMGIVFELPIFVMIFTKIGILSPQYLIAKRKYAIVIIWIMAAVITPPDVLSQIIIAIPVMLLYEISIRVSRYVIIKKKRLELAA